MEKLKERLYYIDNLRLVVIVFVVMHHLAVTYSGFGSWYYHEAGHLDALATIWFAFYLSLQQGYFMGLLFLLAGYFTAGSYDRKGFGQFVGDRFKRLMLPSLVYMIVITPFIGYVELGQRPSGFDLPGLLSGTGVMWFAAALFFFSLIYALFRLAARGPVSSALSSEPGRQLKPSLAKALILILIISVFAFLIRIVQPLGTNVLNMQLCYFASYIVLYIVGVFAYRNNLFARISYKAGKWWLISGIILGFLIWLVLVSAVTQSGNQAAMGGGVTWQSAAFSIWESFVAVAMSMGLIAVFREKFNNRGRLVKALSDSSFTVYMFHPVILVAVCLLFRQVHLVPIVKWAVLCVICVPLCFGAAHFVIRRIPIMNKIL